MEFLDITIFFNNIGQFILDINWLGISQFLGGLGAIIIAGVAAKGLHTWKKEIGHKEKLKTVTDLLEVMTEFYYKLRRPIEIFKVIEIQIDAFSTSQLDEMKKFGENAGFIKWIEVYGKPESKRLFDELENISTTISKTQTLILKGECIGLDNFTYAKTSYVNFVLMHTNLWGFAQFLGLTYVNWENPQIQESLTNWRKMKSPELEKQIVGNFESFLENFAKVNLKLLLH